MRLSEQVRRFDELKMTPGILRSREEIIVGISVKEFYEEY